MNSNLVFDFIVNKENNTVNVKREFNSTVDVVWKAWTTPEILDQWWAPKPYTTNTISMDFREGGTWLYYMESPEGNRHYCKNDYQKITIEKSFTGLDAFCDDKGNVNPEMPRTLWTNDFSSSGNKTMVSIVAQYASLEDLEKVIALGFKEGFTMAMQNLDQYIEAQFWLRRQSKPDNTARTCSYLNFPGNTEEAFLFYKSVFQTEFINGITRFEDIPPDANHPPVADAIKKMVLHIELPITGGHILMATDAPPEMGFTLTPGNNMHICIEPETKEEAKRIFDELAIGGEVTMPLADMFFGAYFGSLTDKYGINWMINVVIV
jgi:uncharacterized glyoxalase superfamily protein PhnB/uncharacterized protein YndB with AHSA1/START domain